MTEASDLAVQRIQELFRQPDDLDKINVLKARFTREKNAVDAQLKAGVEAQLNTTQAGLKSLHASQTNMNAIREEMLKIDKLCAEAQAMVRDFPVISKISRVHKNFNATQEMVHNLQSMHDQLDRIEEMLRNDGTDILKSLPSLLAIHMNISRLQDFRDKATSLSLSAPASTQSTLANYFVRLDQLTTEFTDLLWKIAGGMLDILKDGRASVVVRAAKIVEVEERADEKALAIQEAQKAHAQLAARMRFAAGSTRVVRGYKDKFFAAIASSVATKFEMCWKDMCEDPAQLLEELDWVFEDLDLVREALVLRVPRTWDIYEAYVQFYHKGMYELLNKLVASEPDAASLLKVVEYVKEYYSTLTKELGVVREQLVPPLLDGGEGRLVDDYLGLIVRKVEEWMSNLAKTETRDFVERNEAPEQDEDEKYHLSGAVIMFQMISQQIDLAADSGQGKVLAAVVEECVRVMKKRQQEWEALLKDEERKHRENAQDVPGGLVEYTIALANDQIRCSNYAEAISERVEPLVSAKYAERITKALEGATEGYIDLATRCNDSLVRLIFNDVRGPFSQFFTPGWYSASSIVTIVDTFRDYTSAATHLIPEMFEVYVGKLLEEFVRGYVSAIYNKGAKFRPPGAIEQIRNDVLASFSFFSEYMPPEEVEHSFRIIEHVLGLLSVPPAEFWDEWVGLKREYPDTPVWFVEDLLWKREDVEKSSVRSMLDMMKTRDVGLREEDVGVRTLMSQVERR
ncbi:exocyst complex component Sec6 [Saitoella complicata NRRL Y-17804]|uniref:exocyst complex component Sec6 n=1 Tax=Saitoella complicata (strain BCRC 22490 / CBS 7301 / JCM 7358 / NBRC 10748 / NRRL Y-17804) TaxID=698492 RepID=UPI0008677CC1|nr:exocyst complex component Sec6 [Saitoella complicata NRRL Y-17804]ODQ50682.1 exocyst complex component Sec6 [Saitoella complicata NRRL Y-17804]